MITVKKYLEQDKATWDTFVKQSKMPMFMFERGFMDYHSDRFIDNSLMFYSDDNLIALLPSSIHNNELRSHGGLTYGGFIVGEEIKQHKMLECFNSLKEYMAEKQIKQLLYKKIPYIYHSQPADEDLYGLYRSGADLFKIEPSTVILLKDPFKMPKGRKAQISRAKREGVIIKESNDFDRFIDLENEILKEHHNTKAVHTAEELKLLKSRFNNEIQLYIAEYGGETIASVLLFVYENTVHTQYMASNDIGREIGALDLLIKTLMDKFSNDKTYFDFGISTESNGSILNEGLISQKEGFGGRTVCYASWVLLK